MGTYVTHLYSTDSCWTLSPWRGTILDHSLLLPQGHTTIIWNTFFYKIWKLLFVYNLSSNTLASTDKHIIIYSIGSLSFSCRNNQLVDLKIALQEWAASCVSRATLKLRQLHWIFIQGPFNNQGLTNWHNKWHIWLYYWWK